MIRRPTLDQVSIMLLVTRHSWLAGAVGGGISRRPLDRACDHYDRSLHRDGSCCAGVLVAMGAGNQVRGGAVVFKSFEFCIPTKATGVPTSPDWLHEIEYDGLYEASRVKKVFRDQHFFFSAFQ